MLGEIQAMFDLDVVQQLVQDGPHEQARGLAWSHSNDRLWDAVVPAMAQIVGVLKEFGVDQDRDIVYAMDQVVEHVVRICAIERL